MAIEQNVDREYLQKEGKKSSKIFIKIAIIPNEIPDKKEKGM